MCVYGFLLSFDKNGKERLDDPDGGGQPFSHRLVAEAAAMPPSHIFLFSHGWKGDLPAAIDQYNRWIKAVADVAGAPAGFKPFWIGLHWPSQPWGDEEFGGSSFDAQEGGGLPPDALVQAYLDRLDLDESDRPLIAEIVTMDRKDPAATELPESVKEAYTRIARKLGRGGSGPSGAPGEDGEPFDAEKAFEAGNQTATAANFGFLGGLMGGILDPLRQLSFWQMKKRARSIGESGMHQLLATLMGVAPNARIHLMGHSFGCIVAACMVGGPGAAGLLPRPVDSLVLVQGAVSSWSFAPKVPSTADPGYFLPVRVRKAVRGPIVTTRSIHDGAVGTYYPLAGKLAFSNPSFGPGEGEPLPVYGGLGTFGAGGVAEAHSLDMLAKDGAYPFAAGQVYNLEASKFIRKGDGPSGAHSDIDGPEVAWAIWSAAQV